MSILRSSVRIKPVFLVFSFYAVFTFLSLLFISNIHSAEVTLAWNANPETNIAGYRVHYGTASGKYYAHIDVGNSVFYTVPNLPDQTNYYFALTAYNARGLESDYSAEAVYNPPPPPPPCSYSVSPTSQSFSASAGSGTVNVTARSECSWTAISNAPWILITPSNSASGSGTLNYYFSENTEISWRTGTLTVAGQTFTLTQSGPACAYTLAPSAQSFAFTGGTGRVIITAPPECPWIVYHQDNWMTINSENTGTGSGFIDYSVFANLGIPPRTGLMSIAGETFTVTQSGSPQGRVVLAINSGGNEYLGKNGGVYQIDQYYLGGWSSSAAVDIFETEDVPLYETERYGNFSYVIPLANGNYEVTLKFAEIYWSAPGQRVFDVWIEGRQVLTDFDILAVVGKNRAHDVTFPVTVTDGQLDIDFQATVDYAKVSAITVMEPPSPVILAINCGGGEYIDDAGMVYQADQYSDGGWVARSWERISGTNDGLLYETVRYGDFTYSIPLANGNYEVVLKFAEIYWDFPGSRVFDVWIEGMKVISELDIFALVGKNKAYDISFPVTITDGRLDILFDSLIDFAKVNAIVVRTR